MRYRVQYCVSNERRTTEIEAASPEEAIVKFRHIRRDGHRHDEKTSQVLSVSPEPECTEW